MTTPALPSSKEIQRYYALTAVLRVASLAIVPVTWFLTRNNLVTGISCVLALVGVSAAAGIAATILDYFGRKRFASKQLSLLASNNSEDRLRAVSGLTFLGTDNVAIIQSLRTMHPGSSVEHGAQAELAKYVYPGLKRAASDTDPRVRRAALEALRKIGSLEALTIIEELS